MLMMFFLLFSLNQLISENNLILSSILFTCSVLIKYTPLLLTPLIMIYLFKDNDFLKGIKRCILYFFVGFAVAAIFTMPFFRGWDMFNTLLNLKFLRGVESNTLPYVFILALQKVFHLKNVNPYNPSQIIIYGFHFLFFFSYVVIIIGYLKSKKHIEDMATAFSLVFISYFAFESFQLNSWYFIWLMPFLLISKLKRKEFLALALSFVGLICFYKRVSFLLIIVAFLYFLYVFLSGLRQKLFNNMKTNG